MRNNARWLMTVLGVTGAVMNACLVRESFLVWVVANSGLLIINTMDRRRPEMFLFSVYLVTAIVGWLNWGAAS